MELLFTFLVVIPFLFMDDAVRGCAFPMGIAIFMMYLTGHAKVRSDHAHRTLGVFLVVGRAALGCWNGSIVCVS